MCEGIEMRHHGPCLENPKQFSMKYEIHTYAEHRRQMGGGRVLPEILKKETVNSKEIREAPCAWNLNCILS